MWGGSRAVGPVGAGGGCVGGLWGAWGRVCTGRDSGPGPGPGWGEQMGKAARRGRALRAVGAVG